MTYGPIGSTGAAETRRIIGAGKGGDALALVALSIACAQIKPELDSLSTPVVQSSASGCFAKDFPIVFSSTRGASKNGLELYAMNLDGDVRRLGTGKWIHAPAWSPDGRRISFRTITPNVPQVSLWRQVQLMAPDGTERVAVTAQESLPFALDTIVLPNRVSWSPDGETLAYAELDGVGRYRVWLIARQGGEPWRLAPDLEVSHHSPSWSPVASDMAFVAGESGLEDLWVLDLERPTEPPLNLSQGRIQTPRWPRWSPDGKRLVFSGLDRDPRAADGGDFELYVLDIPTLELTRLTQNDVPDLHPAWSPDGRSLLVTRGLSPGDAGLPSFDTLFLDLWTLPLDDPTQGEQLTHEPWMNCGADWFSGQCE